MAFKDIKKNIPPKARLMIISSFLIVGAFIWFTLSGSSNEDTNKGVSGSANIDLTIKDKIKKTNSLTPSVNKEGSLLSKEIEALKSKDREEEKSKPGSFIEELRLKNAKKVKIKISEDAAKNSRTPNHGMAFLGKRQREKAKAEENKKILERAEFISGGGNKNNQSVVVMEPFDESNFIDSEIDSSQYKKEFDSTLNSISSGSIVAKTYTSTGTNANEREKNANGSFGNKRESSSERSAYRKQNRLNQYKESLGNNKDKGNDIENFETAYNDLVSPVNKFENSSSKYITTGTIFYASLDIGVNTDSISPVRATIIQEGLLNGAVLIGLPTKNGDTALLNFTSMSLDGVDYGVSVVALDPATMRTGLADDVDHHTFERYFGLATAAVFQGYAEALTGAGKLIRSDGTSEEIIDNLPRGSDRLIYATGKVGEVLVPKFEQMFDRESTIKVNSDRDLGIMFMNGLQIQK